MACRATASDQVDPCRESEYGRCYATSKRDVYEKLSNSVELQLVQQAECARFIVLFTCRPVADDDVPLGSSIDDAMLWNDVEGYVPSVFSTANMRCMVLQNR